MKGYLWGVGRNHLYNICRMNAYIYIYKLSVRQGRPSWGWLVRCRWYLLTKEESDRFRHIEDFLERWRVPRVSFLNDRAYIVLKVYDVREFLSYVARDLIYDTVISDQRVRALEDGRWEIEVVKFDAKLFALWQVGLLTKTTSRITEARALYEEILADLRNKTEKTQRERG
jgi:hypothetical protein